MIDSKALCRNHSDPSDDFYFDEYDNNDTYDYNEFEVNVPSKTYDSVYLSDYIKDHDLNYKDTTISSSDLEMDSDLQFAIISSLESSHRPLPSKSKESKESKPKKSRKSRRKIKENSFENYWNECTKFNKTLKNKRKSTKKGSVGMSDSQQSQIRKVLREYMRLCHQSQGTHIGVRKSNFSGGTNPFSVGSIYSKLNSIAPQMTFKITPLATARSTDPDALAFHGTPYRNVESIKERGLVVGGTNGVAISNGAAYGKGVYCSPSLQFASGYSGGAIFVCEVSKSPSVRKSGEIWVVPQSQMIKPVLLVEYDGGYLSEHAIPHMTSNWIPKMGSNSIYLFIPSIGPLNTPFKHRSKQRRFSTRPDKII